MGLWQIFVISAGLSLDVFAYCLYKGAMISEVKVKELAKMVGMFSAFQAGMVLVGSLITMIPGMHDTYSSANAFWMLVAAIIFFALGIYMIIRSRRKKFRTIDEARQDDYNYRVIVVWAFITSIDALIAGVGFGFLGLGIIVIAVIVAVFTALSAILGMLCGYWLGCSPMNTFVAIGGCLVLIGAADLLYNYLLAV